MHNFGLWTRFCSPAGCLQAALKIYKFGLSSVSCAKNRGLATQLWFSAVLLASVWVYIWIESNNSWKLNFLCEYELKCWNWTNPRLNVSNSHYKKRKKGYIRTLSLDYLKALQILSIPFRKRNHLTPPSPSSFFYTSNKKKKRMTTQKITRNMNKMDVVSRCCLERTRAIRINELI